MRRHPETKVAHQRYLPVQPFRTHRIHTLTCLQNLGSASFQHTNAIRGISELMPAVLYRRCTIYKQILYPRPRTSQWYLCTLCTLRPTRSVVNHAQTTNCIATVVASAICFSTAGTFSRRLSSTTTVVLCHKYYRWAFDGEYHSAVRR